MIDLVYLLIIEFDKFYNLFYNRCGHRKLCMQSVFHVISSWVNLVWTCKTLKNPFCTLQWDKDIMIYNRLYSHPLIRTFPAKGHPLIGSDISCIDLAKYYCILPLKRGHHYYKVTLKWQKTVEDYCNNMSNNTQISQI